MPNVVYDSYHYWQMGGGAQVDLDTDTIKLALVTSAYVPDKGGHVYFSHVTNEVTGAGYTAGGAALAGKALANDTANHKTVFTANNVTWASATITARGAVLYKSTGVASTSPLIGYIDFGADVSSVSPANFVLTWNALGVLFQRQGV